MEGIKQEKLIIEGLKEPISIQDIIEHFKDLDSVLSKISELVKEGGIFAFATPSGEGISAKSDLDHLAPPNVVI